MRMKQPTGKVVNNCEWYSIRQKIASSTLVSSLNNE